MIWLGDVYYPTKNVILSSGERASPSQIDNVFQDTHTQKKKKRKKKKS